VPSMVKDWATDLVAYVWHMGHRWLGTAITGISVVLAVATDIRHHSIGLPVWGWALVAMGGIVIAGFLEWRTLYHHPEHVAKIRRIAESVHDSLGNGRNRGAIEYSDGVRSDEVLKEMFQGHCPKGITALLGEWDQVGRDIPATETDAITQMKGQVAQEVRSGFPQDRDWFTGTIIDHAAGYLERRFVSGSRNVGLPIALGTDAVMWGTTVIRFVDLSDDAARAEAESAIQSLRESVERVAAMWPADQLRNLVNRRAQIVDEVYKPLQLMIHGAPIRGRCPGCLP